MKIENGLSEKLTLDGIVYTRYDHNSITEKYRCTRRNCGLTFYIESTGRDNCYKLKPRQ